MEFIKTKTFQNLANSFAGESQARNRYTFFASIAKNEGHQFIQQVFEATADNEREHAKVFYKLLNAHTQGATNVFHVDADYPLVFKDTLTNLQAAAEGEREEWEVIYAKAAEVAEQEGFKDIATAFREIAKVEEHHMKRFAELAAKLEKGTLYKMVGPTSWKCTNCGYVYEGPEAPDVCPACQHPKGYFQELPQTY
ncbi:rubrerythrin [Desulfitobacterium sp.]|uniref:rubrerythrin n=1 Tax=Desulfitobacterium sp. TaxID=49981 RepID=UPI002CF1FB00|nr:rubrerythrin family protein [Desulfitobacterium sp.]HVJ47580.1 rubrerythrin family protein [Desulfitobacterium sp.]